MVPSSASTAHVKQVGSFLKTAEEYSKLGQIESCTVTPATRLVIPASDLRSPSLFVMTSHGNFSLDLSQVQRQIERQEGQLELTSEFVPSIGRQRVCVRGGYYVESKLQFPKSNFLLPKLMNNTSCSMFPVDDKTQLLKLVFITTPQTHRSSETHRPSIKGTILAVLALATTAALVRYWCTK